MTEELDKLYQEYREICVDRGVFAKSRRNLSHNDEADWLTYVIALIAGYPSREERQATLEGSS